jgi:hypothetical protein
MRHDAISSTSLTHYITDAANVREGDSSENDMLVQIPQSHCRAGIARGDITPPVGMYHRMWGAATHDRSTGVHRPLLATVVVFESMQGTAALVLVALDHCILANDELARIRAAISAKLSFAEEQIHVTLSHTHGAGLMMRDRADLPGGDMIAQYLDGLASRVAQLALEAKESLRPVVIAYATGRCDLAADRDLFDKASGKYVCGFNPGKVADDTLVVARIDDRETNSILATVVNYACHPTTLAWQNTLISPDFIGAMRETIESATAGAPCVFLQGASGELAPREQYTGDTAVADRNGRRLGHAALSSLESLPTKAGQALQYNGPVVSGALLGTWNWQNDERDTTTWRQRSWDVMLDYRGDLPTLAHAIAERDRLIEEEKQASDSVAGALRDLHAKVEQATRQVTRLKALPPGDKFPLRASVLHLGDAIWIWVAGEHYSALQTRLRERFPGKMLFITTVTDGWQPGYLPTRETYGKGIYQEIIALVERGSLERLIDEIAAECESLGGRENDA